MRQFIVAWDSLQRGRWKRPLLGAIANIGFDMLTLYFLFIAAGHNVSLGILFAGYGLSLILGKMAFLLPGGVGVIEGSMVALFDSLGVPNPIRGEFVDLHWNYPRHAVPAVRLGVRFCPVAFAAHAGNGSVNGALCTGD